MWHCFKKCYVYISWPSAYGLQQLLLADAHGSTPSILQKQWVQVRYKNVRSQVISGSPPLAPGFPFWPWALVQITPCTSSHGPQIMTYSHYPPYRRRFWERITWVYTLMQCLSNIRDGEYKQEFITITLWNIISKMLSARLTAVGKLILYSTLWRRTFMVSLKCRIDTLLILFFLYMSGVSHHMENKF